jgi:hypothetical protein
MQQGELDPPCTGSKDSRMWLKTHDTSTRLCVAATSKGAESAPEQASFPLVPAEVVLRCRRYTQPGRKWIFNFGDGGGDLSFLFSSVVVGLELVGARHIGVSSWRARCRHGSERVAARPNNQHG